MPDAFNATVQPQAVQAPTDPFLRQFLQPKHSHLLVRVAPQAQQSSQESMVNGENRWQRVHSPAV